jgi:hypothetical protein
MKAEISAHYFLRVTKRQPGHTVYISNIGEEEKGRGEKR